MKVYIDNMSQLTRQDIAEVVEEVLDCKLDEKLDQKLDEKLGAFVKHLDDKFNSLAETVSLMNTTMGTLARRTDLDEVRRDMKTIKLAATDTNKDLHRLERRFGVAY